MKLIRAIIRPETTQRVIEALEYIDIYGMTRMNVTGRGREMGISLGRKARPGLKIGICGEHGGDPASVTFCYHAGMDYVSCSPFRVPVARLAAAQAVLTQREAEAQARKAARKSAAKKTKKTKKTTRKLGRKAKGGKRKASRR